MKPKGPLSGASKEDSNLSNSSKGHKSKDGADSSSKSSKGESGSKSTKNGSAKSDSGAKGSKDGHESSGKGSKTGSAKSDSKSHKSGGDSSSKGAKHDKSSKSGDKSSKDVNDSAAHKGVSKEKDHNDSFTVASENGLADESLEENGSIPDPEQQEREKLLKVLSGCLDDLPPLSSKIVRIFTSSTFTDTTLERNNLMEQVYPKLKDYCREKHGLEFQVVDMRWGVRDDATDDHMTTKLCMQEIENCQRVSMGPNFIVFLGQKYGYRPIPAEIVASEYVMLRDCAKQNPEEVHLLDEWYKRDDNFVPPVYVLQPISSVYTNFNNKGKPTQMEQDQAAWWNTLGQLTKIIRKAAQVLFITKKIDREQMHHYFMSVTEREVQHGILKAQNVEDHCLAYIRDISNMNLTLMRIAGNFVDMAARSVDNAAQELLKTLRDDKLPKRLSENNITRFTVDWAGKNGIDPEVHLEYFNKFCDHFHKNVIRLVDNAMAKHERLANDPVYLEPLQHLHACKRYCKAFQGREEVVDKIHDYVLGDSSLPLVLNGESGCGKTSLMAKAASQVVTTWFSGEDGRPARNVVMVLRFLGTTPGSSTIVPLLTSYCQQLSVMYDQPLEDIPDELSPLTQYFKKLIQLPTEEKPLVLFFDSLDQLSGADGAHNLTWMPIRLPPNVKVIISVLPNYYGLLDLLKVMIDNEDSFIQILPLGENLSSTIITAWLKNANKSVTEEQWQLVNEAITKCNLPLFVRLTFDEICRWRSYSKPMNTVLAFTIHDCIIALFERVETQHGKTLVSHAFGYITASKSGVSEPELEDLISLDDKVLNDIYQYHLPPVRRIPPLLWTRIRNDLPGYLSEREADGVSVIGWYHRQFIDAARERYFRNLNFTSLIHSNTAEFFLGTYGGGIPKPFEYSDLQKRRFSHMIDGPGLADRKVPPQPLEFVDSNGKVIRHNLRKLSEMPYHLIRSHRYEDLYNKVFFNYNWLHAKLSSMPLQSVIADFEDMLNTMFDKDVRIIADAIRLSSSILSHYPDMLGPQIAGRLLPYYAQNPKIRSLIQQCDTDGLRHCALVPAYHCLHTPSGPLQFSLEGHHQFAQFGIGTPPDGKTLVSVSNEIVIWDLATGEIARHIIPGIEGIMQNMNISPNGKFAVSYTNNNQVLVCSLNTGEFKIMTPKLDKKDDLIKGTNASNSQIAVWTHTTWYLYSMDGTFLNQYKSELKMPVLEIQLDIEEYGSHHVIVKSGSETDAEMALESHNKRIDAFEFHSAIALNKNKDILYTCIEISDHVIVVYKKEGKAWKYDRSLGENKDPVFSLVLSEDEHYLIATVALGYRLYDLSNDKTRDMKLPHGIRNIPTNSLTSLVVFTKGNQFIVAGVRKNLYVWDTKQGNMVKTLDAHFGRIVALTSVTTGRNAIISSSMDRTIKVWNFDKILEDVHPIDRLDRQIETIALAAESSLCATTTRNMVALWNLETGRLVKTFVGNARSAIVSHAILTADGEYVVSAESPNLLIWDLSKDTPIAEVNAGDIQTLLLNEEDTKIIAVAKLPAGKAQCMCVTLPEGQEVYKFEYVVKRFNNPVLTKEGLFLAVPASDKSGDVIGVYHAKTGVRMYNIQLKYQNYIEFTHIVAMPNDPNWIGVIDPEKGNILDVKKKALVRTVPRWNGHAMQEGKIGLYAPARGGLELINLKNTKTVKTLIPKVAEGVFQVTAFFTQSDQHVVYYHSKHKTVRLFRISDGKMIANYKTTADVKAICANEQGTCIVIGCVDGSLTTLAIADDEDEGCQEMLTSLPSRSLKRKSLKTDDADANGDVLNAKNPMGTALQVARFVAKARGIQKSRACVIS